MALKVPDIKNLTGPHLAIAGIANIAKIENEEAPLGVASLGLESLC